MRPSDRPIFVVGCARSGTTLLQSMIHAHPRLAMPPENRFVIPVYKKRMALGDLRKRDGAELVADEVGKYGTRLKDLGLTRARVRARMYESPPTVGSQVGSVLELYADRHTKRRWGDKRPNYIQFLPELMALFPDAQLVHIIRDGRDCAASLITMPWWEHGYARAVCKWRDAIEAGNTAKSLGSDSYYEIRYEDLVAKPAKALGELCDYLDEDFNPAMLETQRIAAHTPDYKVWHERLQQPVNSGAVQRWRRDLSDDQVALFEHVASAQLVQHGYGLSGPAVTPSDQIMKHWRTAEDHLAARDAKRDADRAATDLEYPHPVAAALTRGQRKLAKNAGWYSDYRKPVGAPPEEPEAE